MVVQYHYTMASAPKEIGLLIKEEPKIIAECILSDDLLTQQEKIAILKENKQFSVLAEWFFNLAKKDEKNKELYCSKTLRYLEINERKPESLWGEFCYFMARQYESFQDIEEAICWCNKARDSVEVQHLLAHLLLTNPLGLEEKERHILILLLVQKKSSSNSCINAESFFSKLHNKIQGKNWFAPYDPKMLLPRNQGKVIEKINHQLSVYEVLWSLKNEQTPINEAKYNQIKWLFKEDIMHEGLFRFL